MNLQQIYQLAIKLGIDHDLRGKEKVRRHLARAKKKFEEMSEKEKKFFDQEKLFNPYSDTRILFDNGKQVKKILAGIDVDAAELILAKTLGYDTVISHHPEGIALADLGDVMHLQAEVLAQEGVPINIAESLTRERISEVARGVAPINHFRNVDAAKILDINFMCIHTPADNMAASFLDKLIKKSKPETVGEVVDVLKTVPEYGEGVKRKEGPKIFVGNSDASAGKILLMEITGGTSGSKDMYEKMSQAGIGTIVGMHISEEYKKEAQRHFINVVIAGHISSDSLGLNQVLDEVEKKGIEVTPFSGLIRVKRFQTKKVQRKNRK